MERVTYGPLKPLGSVVEVNEDIICRDAGERDGKPNPRVDWVRVQREEDHEEAGEAEHHWDEERDLQPEQSRGHHMKWSLLSILVTLHNNVS